MFYRQIELGMDELGRGEGRGKNMDKDRGMKILCVRNVNSYVG